MDKLSLISLKLCVSASYENAPSVIDASETEQNVQLALGVEVSVDVCNRKARLRRAIWIFVSTVRMTENKLQWE
jgi:hypothetical protein